MSISKVGDTVRIIQHQGGAPVDSLVKITAIDEVPHADGRARARVQYEWDGSDGWYADEGTYVEEGDRDYGRAPASAEAQNIRQFDDYGRYNERRAGRQLDPVGADNAQRDQVNSAEKITAMKAGVNSGNQDYSRGFAREELVAAPSGGGTGRVTDGYTAATVPNAEGEAAPDGTDHTVAVDWYNNRTVTTDDRLKYTLDDNIRQGGKAVDGNGREIPGPAQTSALTEQARASQNAGDKTTDAKGEPVDGKKKEGKAEQRVYSSENSKSETDKAKATKEEKSKPARK